LMLLYAKGDVVEMTETFARFGIKPKSVRDFAMSMRVTAG
jgi:hypothetical protein